MTSYSDLLNQSIGSIIDVKEDKDMDSLFTAGGTTILEGNIKGLDDFELITFLVIKEVTNHTEVKRLLDLVRSSCKGLDEPVINVCKLFIL